MKYISMDESQEYLNQTKRIMDDGTFDNVVPTWRKKFDNQTVQKALHERSIYSRTELGSKLKNNAEKALHTWHLADDPSEINDYIGMMAILHDDSDTFYWKWDDDRIPEAVNQEDAIKALDSLILTVNVHFSTEDDVGAVENRVHQLIERDHTYDALNQLYGQYGDMIDTELSEMGFQKGPTALAQLQANLKDTMDDWDAQDDDTNELKDVLKYVDKIKRNKEPYWNLGEDDREEPRPIDYESIDTAIANAISFSISD